MTWLGGGMRVLSDDHHAEAAEIAEYDRNVRLKPQTFRNRFRFQTINDQPMLTGNDPFNGGLDWVSSGSDQFRAKRGGHRNSQGLERQTGCCGRVAAVHPQESVGATANSGAMARITETDASGHFILENVPQGRFYIMAGRVDEPTYYTKALLAAGREDASVDEVVHRHLGLNLTR